MAACAVPLPAETVPLDGRDRPDRGGGCAQRRRPAAVRPLRDGRLRRTRSRHLASPRPDDRGRAGRRRRRRGRARARHRARDHHGRGAAGGRRRDPARRGRERRRRPGHAGRSARARDARALPRRGRCPRARARARRDRARGPARDRARIGRRRRCSGAPAPRRARARHRYRAAGGGRAAGARQDPRVQPADAARARRARRRRGRRPPGRARRRRGHGRRGRGRRSRATRSRSPAESRSAPHDHVKPALQERGVEEVFWRVRLKPGKPMWFGRRGAQARVRAAGQPALHGRVLPALRRPRAAAAAGRGGRGAAVRPGAPDRAARPADGRTTLLTARHGTRHRRRARGNADRGPGLAPHGRAGRERRLRGVPHGAGELAAGASVDALLL